MIKYNVNEEKQTVAAFFEGKEHFTGRTIDGKDYWINCISNKAKKMFAKRKDFIDYHAVVKAAYDMAFYVVNQLDSIAGVATPNDGKFDVEKFKKIAKARLLRRYYRVEYDVVSGIGRKINNTINSIDMFKYYDSIDSRTRSYEKEIKDLRCN